MKDEYKWLAVLNVIWFTTFAFLIYKMNLSLWWFLFPACIHWTEKDTEKDK